MPPRRIGTGNSLLHTEICRALLLCTMISITSSFCRHPTLNRPRQSCWYSATPSQLQARVYVAVGSNLGDRFGNIHAALQRLCSRDDIRLLRTSFLHETAPMYVLDQPYFLNGAVELDTCLDPHTLLQRLKDVERELGRDHVNAIRNGPRPVDLDVLFYEQQVINDDVLQIPHARLAEREFVLKPLLELDAHFVHPVTNKTVQELFDDFQRNNSCQAVRVLPLHRDRMLRLDETLVMGILNCTPDSFSDGQGQLPTIHQAVEHALEMERHGASIIDIGGESTRPGAKEIAVQTELERTIPVIKQLRQVSDIPISIDTRHAEVARAAIQAGADIVNDVSGGSFDPRMLETIADLAVPSILMHMRGIPETMMSLTQYDDVVKDVTDSMAECSAAAAKIGIQRWLQVADPGIGFAKNLHGNLELLRNLSALRDATGGLPILLGTSRKGFIGKITGASPTDRDPGTISSFVSALCLDSSGKEACNIVRVHNVKGCKQATLVMDAIRKTC
jgi:dihydropteroate synthase/2-amino-4-hydroxy-6-hydroxymethyldihydropteridine diphosphokinase